MSTLRWVTFGVLLLVGAAAAQTPAAKSDAEIKTEADQAQALYNKQDFLGALPLYEDLHKRHPKELMWDERLAMCLLGAADAHPDAEAAAMRERAAALVGAAPWGRQQWDRIADGQQFDGVTVSPINGKANQIEIDFKAGREPSEKCADYYKAYVDDEKDNMIHTEGGDHAPNELNFAFKGTLTINGTAFNICLGQGDHDGSHNWHLCSTSVDADNNGKDGDIGSYRLEQSGSHTFKVSLDD